MKLNLKQLINELNIDRSINRTAKFKKTTQKVTKYNFDISGINYVIDFVEAEMPSGQSVLEVSFKNLTAIEKLKSKKQRNIEKLYQDLDRAKYGLTNTGKSMLIFNEIYNAVISYIEKYKPAYFKYEAIEDNRKKLYNTLLKRAEKQTALKFKRLNVDPETDYRLSNESQRFIYKIEY